MGVPAQSLHCVYACLCVSAHRLSSSSRPRVSSPLIRLSSSSSRPPHPLILVWHRRLSSSSHSRLPSSSHPHVSSSSRSLLLVSRPPLIRLSSLSLVRLSASSLVLLSSSSLVLSLIFRPRLSSSSHPRLLSSSHPPLILVSSPHFIPVFRPPLIRPSSLMCSHPPTPTTLMICKTSSPLVDSRRVFDQGLLRLSGRCGSQVPGPAYCSLCIQASAQV